MNEKYQSRAFSKASHIIIIILVSLFLLISSVNAAPHLSLTKTYTVDGIADGAAHEGSVIVYTYTVKNTGDAIGDDTAYGVSITGSSLFHVGKLNSSFPILR